MLPKVGSKYFSSHFQSSSISLRFVAVATTKHMKKGKLEIGTLRLHENHEITMFIYHS